MAKDTTPQELFKQALAVTTKAMSPPIELSAPGATEMTAPSGSVSR